MIAPKKSFSAGRSNALKNRYSDIVPCKRINIFFFVFIQILCVDDDTLVQIIPSGKEGCFDCFEYSYINASYVPVNEINKNARICFILIYFTG